jgi:hypothetical protein
LHQSNSVPRFVINIQLYAAAGADGREGWSFI